MNVTPRRYADAVVLEASGRLDQDTCEAFLGALGAQLVEGAAVVVDLSELEYVSSAGLRSLVLAARRARDRSARFAVAAPRAMVAEIFAISHFNLVLQIFPGVGEALAAVSAEAAAAFERR